MLEDGKLRQLPFKVPDGYFDTLPLRIQELKLGHSKKSPLPVKRILAFAGSGVAAAVTFLLFVTSNFYGTNNGGANYFSDDFRRSSIKIRSPHSESVNRINNIFKTAKSVSFNEDAGNRLYKEDLDEALIDYLASETYYLDNSALYADF